MANVFVNEDSLSDIADAIRSKLNVQTTYKPGEMSAAIQSISGGGITPTGTIEITQNGVVDVTNYASANVDVSGGGGGTPTGGTFTMDSNGKTVSLTVPSGITNFVFYATDFNGGISDAGGWITVGGIWFNSIGKSFCRYNNNNDTTSSLTVTVTGTTLTLTAQYNLRVEKTYKWYAW